MILDIKKDSHLNSPKCNSAGSADNTPCINLDIFPQLVKDYIDDSHKYLNFPKDYFAGSIIVAVATAIGNSIQVRVKEGYVQSPVIYLCNVGNTGVNKSRPTSQALSPLRLLDDLSYRDFEKRYREYELSKKGDKQIEEPRLSKIIIQDSTPEATVTAHKNNPRGLCTHYDELIGLFKGMGKYSGGTSNDEERLLSAWSGESITVDRKHGKPERITRPFINIIGTIQPDLLKSLGGSDRSSNGMLERIMFVFPQGLKREYPTLEEINPCHSNNWNNIIKKINAIPLRYDDNGNPNPRQIPLEEEAKKTFMLWQRSCIDKCNEDLESKYSKLYSKLELMTVRFSLIIETIKYGCDSSDLDNVSNDSMLSAIELSEYFSKTGLMIHDIINNSNPKDGLHQKDTEWYDLLDKEFKTSEAIQRGSETGIARRSVMERLKNEKLFKKLSHGKYFKIVH